MNFNLVSIRSDSDRIETEVEICRGAIMQARAQSCCESCWLAQTMSPPEQSVLQRAWSQAPRGRLSPWMEAKAWGLREGWRDLHDGSEHGMLTWIAKRVTKGGGGNPTVESVRRLFEKISSDPDWFPGKLYGSPGGRPPALSEQKKAAIARSAMALKRNGLEPTFGLVVAQCPNATINPETNATVGKKRVYDVMREKCYDDSPQEPWTHRPRLSKTVLTPEDMRKRLAWGRYMQGLKHTPAWYAKNLIWTDICNDILPRTAKKATLQAQVRKGGKGWISEGSQKRACNLRGPKESVKQNAWDTVRVWWAPVLCRGKLHIETLGQEFPGDCPEGAATLVQKVRSAINIRFHRGGKPKVLFVDRGRGFYTTGAGKITGEFAAALKAHGLEAFMGSDASQQPGSLQEMMLHETSVAWMRHRLTITKPKKPWEETVGSFESRLRLAAAFINDNYDVAGLTRELPERVRRLIAAKGGKLSK